MCQTACHFAPGLDPLCGNDLRNIVKDQQPGSPRQLRTPRHQYQRILRLAANQSGTGIAQFKRLLPMVESMFGTHTEERIKLDLHIFAKFLQAIDVRQTLPLQRRQGDAKNALGTQIGRQDDAPRIQHHHTCRQVVQNRLQVGARRIDFLHAELDCMAGIGQLLCHVGKGTRQTIEFVAPLQRGLWRQIACCDLPDAIGQQEQRARDLVAKQHRQQHRTKNRQKQAQCQGADVHPAQAVTRQRALLVLAIGFRHRQGVGHQGRWQRLCHHQKPGLTQLPQVSA